MDHILNPVDANDPYTMEPKEESEEVELADQSTNTMPMKEQDQDPDYEISDPPGCSDQQVSESVKVATKGLVYIFLVLFGFIFKL